MSDLAVIDVGRTALFMVFFLAGPLLLLSLVVGLAISIFQAATQINEMTLTFIPKLLAIGFSLMFFLPFMLNKFQSFFLHLMKLTETFVR